MIREMKTIKEKVRALLQESPHLRDDDNKLIANFFYHQIGEDAVATMSGFDVLAKLAEGKLASTESIRRVRQKLQEQEPGLRGKSYKSRKEDGHNTKKEIKEL